MTGTPGCVCHGLGLDGVLGDLLLPPPPQPDAMNTIEATTKAPPLTETLLDRPTSFPTLLPIPLSLRKSSIPKKTSSSPLRAQNRRTEPDPLASYDPHPHPHGCTRNHFSQKKNPKTQPNPATASAAPWVSHL